MTLKTRKPTGAIPPPVILLEGDEGAGKSWETVLLSTSPKVGRMLWMELGKESTADQYGAIPGADYEIVRPDSGEVWDWNTLWQAAKDIHAEGVRARDAGELPVVWVVDVVGALWDFLSEWADNRARASKENARKLAEDPNYEYTIGHNFWNAATDRWHRFLTKVLTFPGIVILLSRGQEITLFADGKPTREKTWKVEGQRGMCADLPVWVRKERGKKPQLIKFRSVINGINVGDRPELLQDFSLEKLIFERLGWDPSASGYRTMTPMVAGNEAPLSEAALVLELAIESAESMELLKSAYQRIAPAVEQELITADEGNRLNLFVTACKKALEDSAPPVATVPAQTTNGSVPALSGATQ